MPIVQAEKIALFDMDGTLANYDEGVRHGLAKISSPTDPPITVHDRAAAPWLVERLNMVRHQRDWWLNLGVLEQNMRVLRAAQEIGFKIHILTKGPPQHAVRLDREIALVSEARRPGHRRDDHDGQGVVLRYGPR